MCVYVCMLVFTCVHCASVQASVSLIIVCTGICVSLHVCASVHACKCEYEPVSVCMLSVREYACVSWVSIHVLVCMLHVFKYTPVPLRTDVCENL